MKLKNLLLPLFSLGSIAAANTAAPGKFFYDGGLQLPGENTPAYKKAIFEKTGTIFNAELGWATGLSITRQKVITAITI